MLDFSMTKNYIVRIYRTDKENPETAIGVIENPETKIKEIFKSFEEMKEKLKSMAKGRQHDRVKTFLKKGG